jgi:hypothetical protein
VSVDVALPEPNGYSVRGFACDRCGRRRHLIWLVRSHAIEECCAHCTATMLADTVLGRMP